MINFGIVLFIIATLNFKLCLSMCARAEYEINGECCPMCAPGNRVYWHCTVDTSTTCVPCPALTYTDEPNGLDKCHPCSVCDAGQGLRVKRSCTRSADTVCEPQEGFYCIEQNKGSCRFAMKHSECRPGQYIRQAGTAFTDTDCGNCAEGTYSNGSFSTCQPHSKCETEIKPGTMSTDAECGNSSLVGIIVGVILVVVVITGGLVTAVGIKLKHKRHNTNRHIKYSQTPTTGSTLGMAGERPPPEGACQSDSEATLPDSGRSVITRNNSHKRTRSIKRTRTQTKGLSIAYPAKDSGIESEIERHHDKEVMFSATSYSAQNTKVNMHKTF